MNNKTLYFSTSGGYTDIQSESIQLLLESGVWVDYFDPYVPKMNFNNIVIN